MPLTVQIITFFQPKEFAIKHWGTGSASSPNPSPQSLQDLGETWPSSGELESYIFSLEKKKNKKTIANLQHINTFFPKNFIGGKLQNIYSTMFTVTICSELTPQNILQLKLTYLDTFKYLLLSK